MAFKGTTAIGTTDWEKEEPLYAKANTIGRELTTEYDKGPLANPERIKTLQGELKAAMDEERKYVVMDEFDY